jgi:AraC-like DNA-binding protein
MSLAKPFRHALPVDKSLFHHPLYLTHAGWEKIRPHEAYPSKDAPIFDFRWEEGRTLPEFCLALNIAGSGVLETHHHRGRVNPGEAFLLRPGEWHRHRPSSETGWTLMWIHFNGSEPLLWMRENTFKVQNNILSIENVGLFRAQLEYLLETIHRKPSVNSANLSRQAMGLLSHFVFDRSEDLMKQENNYQDELVQIAIEYIWNYGHGIVDVPAVASRVGIARRTLDRRFKEATGHSVLDEIQSCRVSRASTLLQETDMPIKHIVYRAGFRSEEHLRLAFQKTYGRSPREYRRHRELFSKSPLNNPVE